MGEKNRAGSPPGSFLPFFNVIICSSFSLPSGFPAHSRSMAHFMAAVNQMCIRDRI